MKISSLRTDYLYTIIKLAIKFDLNSKSIPRKEVSSELNNKGMITKPNN